MNKTNWAIDPTHSELQFKVKHLMITTVTGSFNDFQADVTTSGHDFKTAEIQVRANTASVDSGNSQRDEHLKSADFFNAAQYPDITFTGKSIHPSQDGNSMEIVGDLRIKDATREVKLNTVFAGIAKDPYGNTKAGFSIEGSLNRKDFGLDWNVPLESGMLVSDQVRILGEIQLIKTS